VSLLLPWCPPAAAAFGFVPLPALLTAGLVALVAAYVATTELAKRRFYRTAPDR
jgi:Mg2+-importing ATPase